MKVPIFKLDFEQSFVDRFKDGCANILRSDSLSEGYYVGKFQDDFAKFSGARYALATCNGTAALEVALRAINVVGKKVVVPTNTFFATAVAVEKSGAEPVLVDIEDDTFSICPYRLKDALSTHKDIAAVVLVHIGGIITSRVDEILDICGNNDLYLVEDAAHAHGSYRDSYRAGTIGDIGCFSFFPTKVMTTAEGGMVTTNNQALFEKARSAKNFGRAKDPLFCVNDGDNNKVTEFQGLLGCLELERVVGRINRRALLAEMYKQHLTSKFYRPIIYTGSSYYKCIVKTLAENDMLRVYSKEMGVSLTGEVYRYPLHVQPRFYKHSGVGGFKVADHFSLHHICPPLYPELTEQELSYTCAVLNEMGY